MDLDTFVSGYSLDDIIEIEHQDEQFLALKKAWCSIVNQFGSDDCVVTSYCLLVTQNALISFQIAGSGPLRWEEFSEKIMCDFSFLKDRLSQKETIVDWRYDFLRNSRYNKRLYNNKRKRLEKFSLVEQSLLRDGVWKKRYDNMYGFNSFLAVSMKQKPSDKTIVFATKMFGYAARIVFGNLEYYPMDVPIPLDSRLRKIYAKHFFDDASKDVIISCFQKLSKKTGIPPLHLDSLLWLKYRELHMKD